MQQVTINLCLVLLLVILFIDLIFMGGCGKKIFEANNELLCRPFSESEIKNALFQMEHNKAAGTNAIPIEFLQTCWEIIEEDIIQMFDDLHKGRLDVSRLNYGIITLLPKVSDASKMQQVRPICLLNCLYKWITKVLTITLAPFAGKIFMQRTNYFYKKEGI